jgi:hypothetical protein
VELDASFRRVIHEQRRSRIDEMQAFFVNGLRHPRVPMALSLGPHRTATLGGERLGLARQHRPPRAMH